MNKDYVSYEVAKLLNKKGFDINTGTFYGNGGVFYHGSLAFHSCIRKEYGSYPAPPLHIAQKWLRVEKDIHIMIDVCASGYYPVLWKTNGTFIKTLADKGPNDGGVWSTYEEALQTGILESLKLICQ